MFKGQSGSKIITLNKQQKHNDLTMPQRPSQMSVTSIPIMSTLPSLHAYHSEHPLPRELGYCLHLNTYTPLAFFEEKTLLP